MNFDEVCEWLAVNGFRRVGLDGHAKQIYMNDDESVCVTVEENLDENMTASDEERIKQRLVELGYL